MYETSFPDKTTGYHQWYLNTNISIFACYIHKNQVCFIEKSCYFVKESMAV